MTLQRIGIIALVGFSLIAAISFTVAKDVMAPKLLPKKLDFRRIVSLAPSMSETMVALEQAHRVVGVTIHCENRQLAHAEKIGSFAEPNFEAILAQKPDLVLAVPHVMARNTLEHLEASGIEIFAHQPDSLSDIKYINESIAKKLGIEQKGQALNLAIDQAINNARNIVSKFTEKHEQRTTLIAVFASPFVVAGKHAFASQIVEAFGLINLADDKNASWPVWPLENLLLEPPRILILAEGAQSIPRYQKIFSALGLDLEKTKIRLIVPDRPIFQSPSPQVIEDTIYLYRQLEAGL